MEATFIFLSRRSSLKKESYNGDENKAGDKKIYLNRNIGQQKYQFFIKIQSCSSQEKSLLNRYSKLSHLASRGMTLIFFSYFK